jgi:hypothetical protein
MGWQGEVYHRCQIERKRRMMQWSDADIVVEGVMVARCRVIEMVCFEEKERYRSIVGAGASSFDRKKTSRRAQTSAALIGREERSVRATACGWGVLAQMEWRWRYSINLFV